MSETLQRNKIQLGENGGFIFFDKNNRKVGTIDEDGMHVKNSVRLNGEPLPKGFRDDVEAMYYISLALMYGEVEE